MSERRMVFLHASSMNNPDTGIIADTVKAYGVYDLVGEILGNNYARYPSDYIPRGGYVLQSFIDSCHARGMKFHVSMNVLLSALADEYKVELSDGSKMDWTCPTKIVTRTLMQNLMTELTQYNIDGFMFDYIRYDSGEVCYCPECRVAFENWLGEGPISDWGQFYPNGPRIDDYRNWRTTPVNELVRDMRSWLLSIKPNLEISAAVFQWLHEGGVDYPDYWRFWIGQNWRLWVDNGWLDFVSPMIYTSDIPQIGAYVRSDIRDGTMGRIPLIPFLTNCYPSPVDPNNFKSQVDEVLINGANGWMVWRYGGPGDGFGSGAPDIRTYLDLLNGPPPQLITPFTESLEEGTYRITMPSNVLVVEQTYNFQQWEDGSTNPIRTVNIVTDITISANYEIVIPPPEKSYIQIHAFLDSEEVIADGLIIETGYAFQTPMTIEVTPASYTIKLTYLGVTKEYTANPVEGKTIRIDGQMTPPKPSISLGLLAIPIIGLILSSGKKKG